MAERVSDDGYAIVGIGCRFPGGAGTPEEFWELLRSGGDAIGAVPDDRAEWRRLFDADQSKPGRMYTRGGGFLEHIDQFDARFFGISPREATRIDPQHRLLLEVVWEAFEDAGLPIDGLAGSSTGVFVGISTHDYADVQMYPQHRSEIDAHSNTGGAGSIAANRVSFVYDFRGPSVAVDTACSSALTAVHFACNSMRAGDCTAAVVCGVQILLTPELTIGFCKATMLSPDERCKAFDAAANGYVRSEGAGAVVIKPLRAAIADGDPIYAVIIGSAVNQDGHSSGLTVPSEAAQQAMLRAALQRAGIPAPAVQYVEAHGPGTAVGDPIEARAIGTVFSEGRPAGECCAIGSVKTNIGHLEAASGIAGLIKTALALKHRQIPPSLHFTEWNPSIDAETLGLRVVTSLEPWPDPGAPAIAGVNSFGFGGANAHVLLREGPRERGGDGSAADAAGVPQLFTVSARSGEALKAAVAAHAARLRGAAVCLSDLCHTAALRRVHHDFRLAAVATSAEDLRSSLDAFLAEESGAHVLTGRASAQTARKLAFVFSGMGPQWWGMGRQLMSQEQVFREVLERCDAALRPYAGWSLLEELSADESKSRVADPQLAQVTNFALQVGLTELWASWGIVPDAVVGHSGGAMAAAHVAGVHGLEDAIRLAYHRSRLQGRESNGGRMLAVGVRAEEAPEILRGFEDRVSLAAVNGPLAITFAGDGDALEEMSRGLLERQVFARFLPVTIAYHSPVMDSIRGEFLDAMGDLRGATARIPFVSDTTGAWSEGTECDARYWWRAIREPVRFAESIGRLLEEGYQCFVEIAPHPVLSASVAECMGAQGVKGLVLPTLRRKEDDRATMLRSLGSLHAHGRGVAWRRLYGDGGGLVALPHYPWQRERHWFVPQSSGDGNLATLADAPGDHPLLQRRLRTARPTWETSLGQERLAYLNDHLVQGAVVCPGAAYLEMALAAAHQIGSSGDGVVLRDIEFLRPLLITDRTQTVIQFVVDPDDAAFQVYARAQATEPAWVRHATGKIAAAVMSEPVPIDLAAIQRRCPDLMRPGAFYRRLRGRGLAYGAAFRGIAELRRGEDEALARIGPLSAGEDDGYTIHPALLDAVFQLLASAAASPTDSSAEGDRLFLPTGIGEIRQHQRVGGSFWASCRVTARSDDSVTGDFQVFEEDGRLRLEVRGLRARLVEAGGEARETLDNWLYDYRWEPKGIEFSTAPIARASLLDETPPATFEELRADADRMSLESRWRRYYDRGERELVFLAAEHTMAAFLELGAPLIVGERLSPDSLAGTLGIEPSGLPLARRLLALLVEAGVLEAAGDGWTVVFVPRTTDRGARARQFLSECPEYGADVELLNRAGEHLAAVLKGHEDGRDFLFSPDTFPILERFYERSAASSFYNPLVAAVVARLVAGVSDAASLRILEVGAGTGGTTAFVLPVLPPERTHYVFTDVSPLFLENAKTKFDAYPFCVTRQLNIADDPLAQGFAAHSFDVVIAANVIHATPDVARSIAHARSLLAPGGALILLEITRHPLWLDVIFGQTAGWWMFTDSALRREHPLLEADQWRQVLADGGFEGVATVSDRDRPGEAAQTLVMGRRARDAAGVRDSSAPVNGEAGQWLILADGRGVGDRVATALSALGHGSILVSAGRSYRRATPDRFEVRRDRADEFTADVAALFEALAPRLPLVRGIVHLWSLDAETLSGSAEDVYSAAQALGTESALALFQGILRVPELRSAVYWLVTAGAHQISGRSAEMSVFQSPLWGLGRVIIKENPEIRCRMVDLGAVGGRDEVCALVRELTEDDREEEIGLRGRERLVRRLRRTSRAALPLGQADRPAPPKRWRAEIGTRGSLGTLRLRGFEGRPLEGSEVEIEVGAASVNYRDVMLAMGTIPGLESELTFGRQHLGSDAAGRIVACGANAGGWRVGDEVVAMAPGAMGSFVTTDGALVARKPAALCFEDATTVPTVFVTAWYALEHLARLGAGESILIHSATGGVGLAAVQIARHVGARIFATAGSAAKREYLESIGITDVMDSRSLTFADQVRERTNGLGVDVVLNSLVGEAMARGISLLKPYGRFLEIGKRDIYANRSLGLSPFRRNLSFFAIDLDRLCAERPEFVGGMLREVVDRINAGTFKALPAQVFPVSEIEAALRLVAQAKHIGKVVLSTGGSGLVVESGADRHPRVHGDATYLVTGGLGGFGLAVADWLVAHGARALVLMGRHDPSDEAARRIRALRERGATIEFVGGDVSRGEDVGRVMGFIRDRLPPLRGVVHAAMVLEDTKLAELSREALCRVMAPKALGAWTLHAATLREPLDFFVMFSSIASLLGNPLQANYGAASAFLDSLAHYRRARGMPALTINWGVLSGVGYVADRPDLEEFLEQQGYLCFAPRQALEVLDELLRRDVGQVMAARINWRRFGEFSPRAAASRRVHDLVPVQQADAALPADRASILARLATEPATVQRAVLLEYLRDKVGTILGIPPAGIELTQPLTALGLDSLMAVELMTLLNVELGVELPVVKLLDDLGIERLASRVLTELGLHEPAAGSARVPTTAPLEPRRSGAVEASVPPGWADNVAPAAAPARGRVATSPKLASAAPEMSTGEETPSAAPASRGTGNGAVDYASLDYSRWSFHQRIVRGVCIAGFGALGSIHSEGIETIPASGPCILAVNHLSMADVPLVLTLLRRRTIVFATDELRRFPVLDWFVSDLGQAIYVRRNDESPEQLKQALAVLRAGGIVALSPEGRRSKTGLIRGRTGVAYIATAAGVPVVPFVAWGQEKWRERWKHIRRLPIFVRAGEPLRFPPGPATPASLREYTDQIMMALARMLPAPYRGVYSEAVADTSERNVRAQVR